MMQATLPISDVSHDGATPTPRVEPLNRVSPGDAGPRRVENDSKPRLLVVVISWNRPEFLRRTLDSLFAQTDASTTDVCVVDNGSEEVTRGILTRDPRLTQCHFFATNRGINAALETALTHWLAPAHRWVLVSDADMEYRVPITTGIDLLESHTLLGAVSFQHSPEHPVVAPPGAPPDHSPTPGSYLLKHSERGCALLFRTETLARMRPLPVQQLKDFDWWVCRDAPGSLQSHQEPIAVLPGGARHLGWRTGDSTWQSGEIPEFEESRHPEVRS